MAKASTQIKATKSSESKTQEVVAAPVEVAPVKKGGKKAAEPVAVPEPVAQVTAPAKKGVKKAAEQVVAPEAVAPVAPVVETVAPVKKGGKKAAVEPVAEAVVESTPVKKGGAKKAAKKEAVKAAEPRTGHRFFRCVYKTTAGQIVYIGRYSGRKPKQAACKALTGIVKSNDLKVGEKVTFLIQECTRGSKKKKYSYVGSQVDLDTPVKITITKKDQSTDTITYTKNNVVKKISLSECGDLLNVDLAEDAEVEEVKLQRVEKKPAKAAAKEAKPSKETKAEAKPAKAASKAKKN
jgi:hypothetical protein